MASFCVSAPCNVASSASSLSGLSLSFSPRPSLRVSSPSPPRALALSKKHDAAPASPPLAEDRDMRRRAVVFAAFVSALSLTSAAAAFAAETPAVKKNSNKCPIICVQNRTASCCYGH